MPDTNPPESTSHDRAARWQDSYTPPPEFEGLNGELTFNHFGKNARRAAKDAPSRPLHQLPPKNEIDAARQNLTQFLSLFFADEKNRKMLAESRQFFQLQFDNNGLPLLPRSDEPGEWYEVRALLRSFGVFRQFENTTVDNSTRGPHNLLRANGQSIAIERQIVEAMRVVQILASAATR